MIKLVFCCRRKPELTREEFLVRWKDAHGPLVRKIQASALPSMKRYVQSHSLPDELSAPIQASRGALPPFDGLTEVWFDDLESMAGDGSEAAIEGAKALLADEAEFLDLPNCHVFLTEEHEIF